MIHELKTWPEYYLAIARGQKTFEVRKNDRGFAVGDILKLRHWDPATEQYNGRYVYQEITYLLEGGRFGIKEGFVVMGIRFRIRLEIEGVKE